MMRGKWGGALAFVAIAALVVGGLGGVTAHALHLEQDQQRLEQEQVEARAQEKLNGRVREALWRLDSRVWPVLAKEDSRPYNDYSAFYTPTLALANSGKDVQVCQPGTVVLPSPLLNADLPDWMLLHFRTGDRVEWGSPQVLSESLNKRLADPKVNSNLWSNVTPGRQHLLLDLSKKLNAETLLSLVQQRGADPRLTDTTLLPATNPANTFEQNRDQTQNPGQGQVAQPQVQSPNQGPVQQLPRQGIARGGQLLQGNQPNPDVNNDNYDTRSNIKYSSQKEVQSKKQLDDLAVAVENLMRNGETWLMRKPATSKTTKSQQAEVNLSGMVPLWLGSDGQERLIVARLVDIGERRICQGILLDWPRLQEILADEVVDLFPDVKFHPVRSEEPAAPERTMTALPIELEPGPVQLETPAETPARSAWTPLRVGLSLAWLAAFLALAAVGLGGWSLIDLSQRRIRFVSAVTHELRTPLTTLRLYLDMLTGGIVKDEKQRSEYLETLNAETDRLSRLVGNVLDFSRLENQRPRLERSCVAVADVVEQVRSDWQARCSSCGMELIVENQLAEDTRMLTDEKLVQQILGNLIDNACKYARGAEDRRIWLRARLEGKRLVLEVEDGGPGVPAGERRSIFRAFRRGHASETTGGVGLGLALARRWANLLGGQLRLIPLANAGGACFRLDLPA